MVDEARAGLRAPPPPPLWGGGSRSTNGGHLPAVSPREMRGGLRWGPEVEKLSPLTPSVCHCLSFGRVKSEGN